MRLQKKKLVNSKKKTIQGWIFFKKKVLLNGGTSGNTIDLKVNSDKNSSPPDHKKDSGKSDLLIKGRYSHNTKQELNPILLTKKKTTLDET